MEGWLTQRGAAGMKKGWKRRYFALGLDSNALEYYERVRGKDGSGVSTAAESPKLLLFTSRVDVHVFWDWERTICSSLGCHHSCSSCHSLIFRELLRECLAVQGKKGEIDLGGALKVCDLTPKMMDFVLRKASLSTNNGRFCAN